MESKHSRRKTRQNVGVYRVLPGAIITINGLSASMAIHGPASPDKNSEAEPNLCSEVNSLTSHPSPFLGTLEVVMSNTKVALAFTLLTLPREADPPGAKMCFPVAIFSSFLPPLP